MPGPEACGSIIGFSDVHTRAHLYCAILEGLAYALREGRDRVGEEMTKTARTFEPNQHTCQIYDELFYEVYSKIYQRLNPLYHKMHLIIR
ncbi:hypothetical protein [Candidatus Chlorohelix sp.]|uniref:hypothetical protein n=1 Tax=Candidatus Chlorohelix sp. TaxID=3139201 RepID=UPI00305E0B19